LAQWLVDTKGADIEAKNYEVSNHSITTHTHISRQTRREKKRDTQEHPKELRTNNNTQ